MAPYDKKMFPVRHAPGRKDMAIAKGTGVGKLSSGSRPRTDTANKQSARSTRTSECTDDEQNAHSRQAVLLFSTPCLACTGIISPIWLRVMVYKAHNRSWLPVISCRHSHGRY